MSTQVWHTHTDCQDYWTRVPGFFAMSLANNFHSSQIFYFHAVVVYLLWVIYICCFIKFYHFYDPCLCVAFPKPCEVVAKYLVAMCDHDDPPSPLFKQRTKCDVCCQDAILEKNHLRDSSWDFALVICGLGGAG